MKIILLALLLAISGLQAQQHQPYYPHLDNLFLNNKEHEYNYFIYNKTNLIKELLRIRQKTYYNNYSFSSSPNGISSFSGLEIIPLQQNIENFLSTGITLQLLGDKKTHIQITYTEAFGKKEGSQKTNRDFDTLESNLDIYDKNKVALSFPLQMLAPFVTNKDLKGEFFISEIETFIAQGKKAVFIAKGNFSKAFYLKNSGVNSLLIKKIVFELINNELSVKAVYPISNDYSGKYEYSPDSQNNILILKIPFQL